MDGRRDTYCLENGGRIKLCLATGRREMSINGKIVERTKGTKMHWEDTEAKHKWRDTIVMDVENLSGQRLNWRNTEGNTVNVTTVIIFPKEMMIWWNMQTRYMSRKKRNNLQRAVNGNRMTQIKVVHWNMGARLWQNKLLDIMSLLEEKKPEILIVSEANLWRGLQPFEMEIEGYDLLLPPTMEKLGHARIAMLEEKNTGSTHVKSTHGGRSSYHMGKGRKKGDKALAYRRYILAAQVARTGQ